MITWENIIDDNGSIVAPYNKLLALKVEFNDEYWGDLFRIYPAIVIMETERNEPGGHAFTYPVIYSIDGNETLSVLPEEFDSHIKWCIWEDYTSIFPLLPRHSLMEDTNADQN